MEDRQSRLAAQKGEYPNAHRAFLLWLMQAPGRREGRPVARAMDLSPPMIRNYSQKFDWDERVKAVGAGADTLAARMYAQLYHRVKGGREIKLIEKNMQVEYVPPGAAAPGLGTTKRAAKADAPAGDSQAAPTAPEPEVVVKLNPRAQAEELHQGDAEELARARRKRQQTLILDAATARLADQLGKNKDGTWKPFKMTLQDMLVVSRLRRELEAGTVAAGGSNPLATSVRVEQANAKGGDVLLALAEDHDELGLILGTLKASTEGSNVLPFPGGRVQEPEAKEEPG